MGKSRLKEKLGHHWGSGEVSTVWPPVLFYCLVRHMCVCASASACVCVWERLNRQHPVLTWESFMHRVQRDNRWATGRLPVGERRPSDRPLCWGEMDVLKTPGASTKCQTVCVHSEEHLWAFLEFCMRACARAYMCVCVRVCVELLACADDSQQERRPGTGGYEVCT